MGMQELVVILLIVVILFGARKLPQIGEGMGKAIRSFKRGLDDDDKGDQTLSEDHSDESPQTGKH